MAKNLQQLFRYKDTENLSITQYLKRGKLKQTKKNELENGKANDNELD
mgnify:CR=1 FL=1